MERKKRGLINVLIVMMLLVLSLGLVCCTDDGDQPTVTPPDYGEAGTYYFETETDQFTLTLSGGEYWLTIYGNLEAGAYQFDGTTMKLYTSETEYYTATASEGAFTLNHEQGTYRFLKKIAYTVTFETNGGSAIDSVKIINGKTLNKPADPVKEGSVFVGWYADQQLTTPFAFDTTVITADTTVYAQYVAASSKEAEYVATLIVDGEVLQSVNTVEGVAVQLPTPSKQDATFLGWFVSDYEAADKLTYKYDGEQLTQNTKLFAVWESDSLNVSVKGSNVSWKALTAGTEYTVSVLDGEGNEIANPYKTTASSYEFDFSALEAGDYIVNVAANGETSSAYVRNKALDRVSGFTVIQPSILVFDGVENAQKYLITVVCGNQAHNHTNYDNGTSTNFNFINCEMKEGGIEFVVTAMANGYATSVSEKFVYNRELGAVTNLTYDEQTANLTWNKVSGALSYVVEVTANDATVSYTVNVPTISLKQFSGSVEVSVTAVAKGYNSAEAASISFVNQKLAAPKARLDYNTLVWDSVEGAVSYNVSINSQVYSATENKLEIPEELLVKGTVYNVSVQAVAQSEANSSVYSDVLTVKYGEMESVQYVNGALVWDSVGGAYKYGVRVNNGDEIVYDADCNDADITFTKEGVNTVTLYAYDYNYRAMDMRTLSVTAYAIEFDVRGGSEVQPLYKAIGDKITLPQSTKEGYTLAGWYNTPGGADSNGSKYDSQTFDGNGSMLLYAYWQANAYTITLKDVISVYDAEAGKYVTTTQTVGTYVVYYKQNYTLPVLQSADKSKTFGGWYEDDSILSMQYANPLGNSVNVWNLTADHTLYAGYIDILSYELVDGVNGQYYQVIGGAGIKFVTEITVPSVYVDPVTGVSAPVTAIATGAFANCSALQVVNLPDTIESVYLSFGSTIATGSAFYNCFALKEINVYCVDEQHHDNHETFYSSVDGMLLRHASPNTETLDHGVELVFVPYNRTGTLVIPEGVEHITTRSCYGLRFTKAVIPASVKYVGDYVFYGGSYRSIEFLPAENVEDEVKLEIGENTFNNLTALTEIKLPARIGVVDFDATSMFDYAPALINIEIVGQYTADGDNYMTAIDGVVCNYDGSELLYFPRSRTGTYQIPVEIQVIGSNAFRNCTGLNKVVIGDNVMIIESNAFVDCTGLTEVELNGERGSLEIQTQAFYGCNKLREITLPSTVTLVETQAFGNTTALQEVTINCGSDAELQEAIFEGDNGVGYVRILNVGSQAPAFEINKVFSGCRIYQLNIEQNDNYNVDDQNVLYNAEKDKILYYPFGLTGEYVIPETVKEISDGVFENRTNITKITIGKNVTRIGARAFADCVGLSEITFEEGRSESLVIEKNAFEGCLGLKQITLPEMTTSVGDSAFLNCANLESVNIPASLTALGSSTANALKIFDGCTSLASITVADGNAAFATSDGLFYGKTNNVVTTLYFVPKGFSGEVVIPSTVTTIGASIFKDNAGVTKVSFEDNTAPATLTLGASLFENAKSLKEVILPAGLKVIPQKLFMGSSVEKVFVPNSVTTINNYAFANCEELSSIIFEEGNDSVALTFTAASSAAASAFSGTTSLTKLELPDRTAGISNYMFAGSYVTDLKLPSKATSIGNYAFANAKFEEFVMPDSIKTLGTYAFVGCENLKTVKLSANLTKIPQNAFGKATIAPLIGAATTYEAAGIESIEIPASVTSIDKNAFFQCKNLKSVTFAEGSKLTTIADMAFVEAGITSLDIPDSVTTIGSGAFCGCASLKTVTLPSLLTKISDTTFGAGRVKTGGTVFRPTYTEFTASGIESIVIPASVTTIGASAFKDCVKLTSITFEEGSKIESIGNAAFENTKVVTFTLPETTSTKGATTFGTSIFKNCSALREVYLPNTVASLNGAFEGCALTKLVIADDGDGDLSNDPYYVDAERGIVYNGDKNTIQVYFGSDSELVIEEGVHTISAYAFANNTTLKSITLPKSLQKISEYAFYNASALEEVILPGDGALNTIGNYAFSLSAIESIVVPGTVTTMGSNTFEDCTSLNSVVVNTTAMSAYMFSGCTSLTSATLTSGLTFKGHTFEGCTSLEQFEFPAKVNAFGASEFAKSGLTSIHIPAGLPFVQANSDSAACANMFVECKNLTTVTMDSSYTFIPYKMFAESGLTSFTFSKNITNIGTNAFIDCVDLAEVVFPEGMIIVQMGLGAFSGCSFTELDLSGLNSLTFVYDSTFSKYDGYVFAYNESLTTVKLPASLTELPEYMFRDCTALESVEAKGVTVVYDGAFDGCSSLASFTLSANATTIGKNAFSKCSSLTTMDIPSTVTAIGEGAFYRSGITTINLGNGMKTLGKNAFKESALTEITLPASLETIEADAFAKCMSLTKILVEMGNNNFYSGDYGELYNSLNQLVIFPAAASGDGGYVEMRPGTSLSGTYAFAYCKNIYLVKLASSVTAIPNYTFTESSIRRIEIPVGVSSIGTHAFKDCLLLTEVILPESVVSIGANAFSGCSALSAINLPKNVATISASTFAGCTALNNIVLPENLTTIEASAFENSGLTEIIFPAKLTTIKNKAFAGTDLVSVVIPASVTELGTKPSTSSGSGSIGGGIIVKPGIGGGSIGVGSIGGGSIGGGSIGGGSTDAGCDVFANCTSLVSVVFEGELEYCGKALFNGCTALESVTFSDGWTTIYEEMFKGCTALNLELPASIEEIEDNAFEGWTAEQTITISISISEANQLYGEGWNGKATVVEK